MKHTPSATELLALYHQTFDTFMQAPASLEHVCEALDMAAATVGVLGWRMQLEAQCLESARCAQRRLPRGFVVVSSPLSTSQYVAGEIEWFCGRSGVSFAVESMLNRVSQLCALTLHNLMLYTQARQDGLTGLHNQRFLEEFVAQAKREQSKLGVVVASVDIDHFKAINDQRGHTEGNVVLRTVAEALQVCCRKDEVSKREVRDFGVRQGGDEFLLVLRDVPKTELEQVHKDLQSRLTNALKKLAPVKFSYGITYGSTQEIDTLIGQADQRMYQQKRLRAGVKKRVRRAEVVL